MDSFNIENLSEIHITNRNIPLLLKTVHDNILNGLWTFENNNQMFTLTKLDIEKLVFSLMRNLPVIKVNILSYYEGINMKNIILNSHNQLVGLALYIAGVMPKKSMSILDILNALKNNNLDLLEPTEFSLTTNKEKIDLTFKNLSLDIKALTVNREIMVSVCSVEVVTKDILKFIKSMISN